MRALVHVGLAAALIFAPALCCCNLGFLTHKAGAATPCPSCTAEPSATSPAPRPTDFPPPCCHATASGTEPCCHATASTRNTPEPPHQPAKPKPAPHPGKCQCCGERSPAVAPEAAVAAPEPELTGELFPVAFLNPAALPPEHLGLLGGLDPPERAGVDARSEALFSRHVMRC